MNYTIGNSTYAITGAGYDHSRTGFFNPIPKADMVEGATLTLQLDVLAVGTNWEQSFYIQPFATEVCGFVDAQALRWRQHTTGTNFPVFPADSTVNDELDAKFVAAAKAAG